MFVWFFSVRFVSVNINIEIPSDVHICKVFKYKNEKFEVGLVFLMCTHY